MLKLYITSIQLQDCCALSHLYALVLAIPLPKTFTCLHLANSMAGTQAGILFHIFSIAPSCRLSYCLFLCAPIRPSATGILITGFSSIHC